MPTGLDRTLVWGLAAALIVGALVGTEREKSKTVSGNVGIGGVRTFILFALSGALGAWLGPLALLPVILLSSLQGAVVGVTLLLLGKGEPGPEGRATPAAAPAGDDDGWVPPRHAIPYGPFLVLAALEWLHMQPRCGG